MKQVQSRNELLSVLKSCREGLALVVLAVFGSYAKG
jgi:predicted nucleotidyltransferase